MLKNLHLWLPNYISQSVSRKNGLIEKRPFHVMFCLADHFEPRVGGVSSEREIQRVDTWVEQYLKLVEKYKDRSDFAPKYTFFYPIDEYTPAVLEKISVFCKQGLGEVEVHLHHDDDTPDSLRQKLEYAKKIFRQYGLLSEDKSTRQVKYGFIHGNWALDNSRKDGKWCGVSNELEILRDTGCYADFTLPSAPSDTQTSLINSIYYAKGTPEPKSHDRGVAVEVNKKPCGDLMVIQGPLALNWKRRKFGFFPRIENSGIFSSNPPTRDRVDLWIDQGISVKGKPEWKFVKIYTHGAHDDHLKDEYFKHLDVMFNYLEEKYNDGINYKLHYVTAREMYNIIKAAEAGENGDPGKYRNWLLEWDVAHEK